MITPQEHASMSSREGQEARARRAAKREERSQVTLRLQTGQEPNSGSG